MPEQSRGMSHVVMHVTFPFALNVRAFFILELEVGASQSTNSGLLCSNVCSAGLRLPNSAWFPFARCVLDATRPNRSGFSSQAQNGIFLCPARLFPLGVFVACRLDSIRVASVRTELGVHGVYEQI